MKEPTQHPHPLTTLFSDIPMEELAFTPVPVKLRHDGWTPERQEGFVARLALTGCVAIAARGVGKSRAAAYALRELPGAESFGAAWDRAIGWGRDLQTDIGIERSLRGERRPVFYRGRKVGEYTRHDNRLAMAVLSRLDRRADRAPVDLQDFNRLLDALENSDH